MDLLTYFWFGLGGVTTISVKPYKRLLLIKDDKGKPKGKPITCGSIARSTSWGCSYHWSMDIVGSSINKTSFLEAFVNSSTNLYGSTDGAEIYFGVAVCLLGFVLNVFAVWVIISNW